MKKIPVPVIIMFILMIGVGSYIFYSLNYYSPESSEEMISYTEERVLDYLIKEKGYQEIDILTISSSREPKSTDATEPSDYAVEVVFTNEPDTKYLYRVRDNEVYQFGYSGPAIKHKDLK